MHMRQQRVAVSKKGRVRWSVKLGMEGTREDLDEGKEYNEIYCPTFFKKKEFVELLSGIGFCIQYFELTYKIICEAISYSRK